MVTQISHLPLFIAFNFRMRLLVAASLVLQRLPGFTVRMLTAQLVSPPCLQTSLVIPLAQIFNYNHLASSLTLNADCGCGYCWWYRIQDWQS